MESCEVLVVGAGPTGLVAAAALRERGVHVRIVERERVRHDQSRALAVQPRTLEILDKMGLADELVAAGVPARGTHLHVDGQRLVSVAFDDLLVGQTPFPYLLMASQADTERVIERHVERLGAPIERGVELVRIEQGPDGVMARLRRDGVEVGLRCRWLVGADGAHSRVRHELGLPFEGDAYRSDFLLGDVRVVRGPAPADRLQVFLGRSGLFAMFPLTATHRRVIATRVSGDEGTALDLVELQGAACLLSEHPFEFADPTWLARFHLHHRGVPRYRVGRCFVAGDAAHIHSPVGGQGMNTGIQDAYNLAWKLADVSSGRAPEALLDSYHEERHPVGRRLLAFTDRAFTVGASENLWLNTVRSWVAPHVLPRAAELGAPARAFRFVSQLGVRYRRSDRVAEDLTGADAAFRAAPRAGDRAPGLDLLRELRGTGWWLLGFPGVGPDRVSSDGWRRLLEAAVDGRPDTAVRMVDDPDDHARYGLAGPGLYLVRPDGYVAFRSAGMRIDPLVAFLAR